MEASLTEDIKNLVITSYLEIRNKELHDEIKRISKESKDVSKELKTANTVCNVAFEVTQGLSKRIVDLEKEFSKSEAKSIAFEIALQHKSRENNSLKSMQKENENFMASLQLENAHLKQTYKDLFESVQRSKVETNQCDEVKVRKAKFEAYFERLEKTKVVLERRLARKVDDSKAEKDQFLKEINHLRTQLENLKGKSVQTKFDKHSILGKPRADKLLINSQISKSWFTPKVVVQKSLAKPVTAQSLPKNEKDQLLNKLDIWNQNWHHKIFVLVKKNIMS
ncbi:hypothetical protein Tco_0938897 [Tanacetum coccineum]|uniref:Uncharacterized protein n=1 Tax=Tanacetum coccineum TaxID=301880 RepID=A0ABQ5DKZ7_9ASTR